MNKTVGITIAGMRFEFNEEAYAKLSEYLNKINAKFQKYSNGEEITQDIQGRIAEKLQDTSKDVITIKEVNHLIKSMGEVDEFESMETEIIQETLIQKITRRLRSSRLLRDSKNKLFAGVCAGISNYFDFDPVILRIIFTLSTILCLFINPTLLFLPIGIYITLWLSMPEAKTISDQIEMRGENITLSNIFKEVTKESKELAIPDSKMSIFIKTPFELIYRTIITAGRIIKPLLKVLIKISGAGILTLGVLLFVITTVTGIVMFFSPDSELIGLPIKLFIPDNSYYLFVVLGYICTIVPIVILSIIGSYLLKTFKIFSTYTFIALTGIWITGLIGFSSLAFIKAPEILTNIKQNPGIISTKEVQLDIDNFESITVSSNVQVELVSGPDYDVQIEGLNENLSQADIQLSNGMLSIGTKELEQSKTTQCIFCIRRNLKVFITAPNIKSLYAAQNAFINVTLYEANDLKLETTEQSTINLNGKLNYINVLASGSSNIMLIGNAELIDATIKEKAVFLSNGMQSTRVNIATSDESITDVNAKEELIINASGNASVYYSSKGVRTFNTKDNAIIRRHLTIYPLHSMNSTYLMSIFDEYITFDEITSILGEHYIKSTNEDLDEYLFNINASEKLQVLTERGSKDIKSFKFI